MIDIEPISESAPNLEDALQEVVKMATKKWGEDMFSVRATQAPGKDLSMGQELLYTAVAHYKQPAKRGEIVMCPDDLGELIELPDGEWRCQLDAHHRWKPSDQDGLWSRVR